MRAKHNSESLYNHMRPTKRVEYESLPKQTQSDKTVTMRPAALDASDLVPTKKRKSSRNKSRKKKSRSRSRAKKKGSRKRHSIKKLTKPRTKRVKTNPPSEPQNLDQIVLNLQKLPNNASKPRFKILDTPLDGHEPRTTSRRAAKSVLENVKEKSRKDLFELALKKEKMTRKFANKAISSDTLEMVNRLRRRRLRVIEEELEDEMDTVAQFDPKFVKELKVKLSPKVRVKAPPRVVLPGRLEPRSDFRVKFAGLLNGRFNLPVRFEKNLKILSCIDFILRMIKIKKNVVFFSELKRQIQSKLHQKVYLKNLQEIDSVGEGLYSFGRAINTRTDYNEVYVDFFHRDGLPEHIPSTEQSTERHERTRRNYLQIVKQEHDTFLESKKISGFDLEHEQCWHHEFPLNEINYAIKPTPLPRDNTKIQAESVLEKYSRELTESRLSLRHQKLELGESLTRADRTLFARESILVKLRRAGLLEQQRQLDSMAGGGLLTSEQIQTRLRYVEDPETGKMVIDREALSCIGRDGAQAAPSAKLQKIQKRILEEIKLKEKEAAEIDQKSEQALLVGFLGPRDFRKVIEKVLWYYRTRKVRTTFYVKLRDYLKRNLERSLDFGQIKGVLDLLVKLLGHWIEYRQMEQGLLVRIKENLGVGVLFDMFMEKYSKMM